MGPTASKLAKELRKLQRSNVVDLSAVRQARAFARELSDLPQDMLAELPPNHVAWMQAFKLLGSLGRFLLGSHTLRKLSRVVDDAEAYYMPGGPPMSPILDSVFMSWMMIGARTGPRRESLCDIIADIAPVLGLPKELQQATRTLGACRLGVYRMEELERERVCMTDIASGQAVEAAVPRGLTSRAKLSLTRLLPPLLPDDSDWVVWTTPAELVAPDAESQWRAYFERVAGNGEGQAVRVAKHMAAPPKQTYWLDYITDGYAGTTGTGAIALLGVPDRPETLPHSDSFDPMTAGASEQQLTPLERVRRKLAKVAERHGLDEIDVAGIRRRLGAPEQARLVEAEAHMLRAYAAYGALDSRGRTALDLLAEEPDALDADELRVLHELRAGWMSAFEVLHVRVDEGMEVRDVLRRRKLWVSERSATRQVEIGDLLVGWVLDDDGRITLEGNSSHVPWRIAPPVTGMLKEARNALARSHPRLGWKRRAGLLAPCVTPLVELAMQHAPQPRVENHDGEPLLWSEARYAVSDPAALRRRLGEEFEDDGDGTFHMLSGEMLAARITIEGDVLRIETNSKGRLQRAKKRIEALVDKLARHQLDSHEDPMRPGADDRARDADDDDEPMDLTPEMRQAVTAMLMSKLRDWVDQPIAALGDRTPRQAIRSKRGREQVTHLLTVQEQQLQRNPQTAHLDLMPLWESLGLPRP